MINGQNADFLLVLAQSDTGPAFFVVDADAKGVTRTGLTPLDVTRSIATVNFDSVVGRRVDGDAVGAMSGVVDVANLVVASEQIGGAEACLKLTTDYAKLRVAFGRTSDRFSV